MAERDQRDTGMTRKQRRLTIIGGALFVLAVAAGLVLGLWLGTRNEETKPVDTNPAPVFARLTHPSGLVELLSPTGDAQPAHADRVDRVHLGDHRAVGALALVAGEPDPSADPLRRR